MVLQRRVALNGVYLDDLDNRIVITSVETADGKENFTAVDTAAPYGQRITGERRGTLDVVIKFRIRNYGRTTLGMQQRSAVLEGINAWAAPGGYLTVNFKADRRLYVKLVQAPGEGSLWDFSKEFQMTFRAYGIPYWEQNLVRSYTTGGGLASGFQTITVEGSAKTHIGIALRNTSGMVINTAQITVAGETMIFSALQLQANEVLLIDHTEDGLLRIRIRNTSNAYRSVMSKRSTESTDDFVVSPGVYGCSFAAQRACAMTVSWRARYL